MIEETGCKELAYSIAGDGCANPESIGQASRSSRRHNFQKGARTKVHPGISSFKKPQFCSSAPFAGWIRSPGLSRVLLLKLDCRFESYLYDTLTAPPVPTSLLDQRTNGTDHPRWIRVALSSWLTHVLKYPLGNCHLLVLLWSIILSSLFLVYI